jgi:hypothetical protein
VYRVQLKPTDTWIDVAQYRAWLNENVGEPTEYKCEWEIVTVTSLDSFYYVVKFIHGEDATMFKLVFEL